MFINFFILNTIYEPIIIIHINNILVHLKIRESIIVHFFFIHFFAKFDVKIVSCHSNTTQFIIANAKRLIGKDLY
jgi:hypothetical protein